MDCKVIQSGLVLFKGALSQEEQETIAKMSLTLVDNFKISARSRYRIYNAMTTYPDNEYIMNIVRRYLKIASETDYSILTDDPTHLLFLRYESGGKIGFHRDNGENDGAGLNPVISFSIGNSCNFAVKDFKGCKVDIQLDSGDIIMFGGKSRHILHSVTKVNQGTSPSYVRKIIGDNRLNLTFRYAPEILGKESKFETYDVRSYKPTKNIVKKDDKKQKSIIDYF